MAEFPIVTVLMSTYNEPVEYIQAALSSILNQTYFNLEVLVIVDNPQNLEAISFLKSSSQKDNRITIHINERNRGLVYCLNYGISIAKGEYIARMDADDISFHKRIEQELEFLLEHDHDLVSTGIVAIDEGGKVLEGEKHPKYQPGRNLEKQMYFENMVAHPTVLIRKKALDRLNGYRTIKSAEDYDLWLRFLTDGYSIGFLETPLLYRRISYEGVSRLNRYVQFLGAEYVRLLYRQRKKLGRDDHSEEYYNAFLKKHHYFDKKALEAYHASYKEYCLAKEMLRNGKKLTAFKLFVHSTIASKLRMKHVWVMSRNKVRNFLFA
ncbi:Glycosyl transferase family 2 [Sphaerochaeta associata]|uniref:Glycosyltransferase n=1 Tax=Sphaerochaeta associata TaxID=1129264 RepID=A0ABY4DC63_9SPIR|nr:glycosyltransferase [Sphaerochaeta associata]UOM51570.1 glycosyltransferase [Sphaerochaeta associata]SMP65738.1 Glycosyl transferase family 2 [Sphaerochaeta associata]